jgi:class 3 adenylate cyclase
MLTGSGTGETSVPVSVLVVDDEPFNIDLLAQELEELGHISTPAVDGQEALEKLDRERFDLVLLDIMMPRMDGVEVLKALNAAGRLAELPVIVVSALGDIDSIARCLQLGAEDYLIKPFDTTLLRARIGGALEKKGLRDQVARQLAATRALFGRYVPPGVAEHILSGDGGLDPVEQEASVLYCDIAGFTSLVEEMAPAEVMALLNSYFEAVIGPVRANGGVVNEFLGDGILVSFNLPRPDARHADRAVATAFAIREVLASVEFAGHRLSARIGVHSGPVIAGNVTAGDRLHYTVLGDTVNLAARLEEANKAYGTSILISGATVRMLKEEHGLEQLDDAEIRGKSAPIAVFTRTG